jgi:hypothetical protein
LLFDDADDEDVSNSIPNSSEFESQLPPSSTATTAKSATETSSSEAISTVPHQGDEVVDDDFAEFASSLQAFVMNKALETDSKQSKKSKQTAAAQRKKNEKKKSTQDLSIRGKAGPAGNSDQFVSLSVLP